MATRTKLETGRELDSTAATIVSAARAAPYAGSEQALRTTMAYSRGSFPVQCGLRGFSLFETMIALTLGIVLMLVVGPVYVNAKQTYRVQEAQGRMQESMRFLLEFLSNDIRKTGNMGCFSAGSSVGAQRNSMEVIASNLPAVNAASIIGYDATPTTSYPVTAISASNAWNPPAPSNVSALLGTDILSIQFSQYCNGHLQTPISAYSALSTLVISANTCSITTATTLTLSDCSAIEVFRADSATQSSITISNTPNNNTRDYFEFNHDVDAEVMLYHDYTYFIALYNKDPTLFRIDNAAALPAAQPLIQGVEDMQLLYGVDLNGDGSVDQYVTAGGMNSSSWAEVIAMQIAITLQSTGVDGNNLTTSTTACPANPIPQTDARLRQCFGFTVNLRNPRYPMNPN